MSKLISVILFISILIAGYNALQPIAAAMTYATLWDAGNPPDSFAKWSGLESMHTPWIEECRALWMAEKQTATQQLVSGRAGRSNPIKPPTMVTPQAAF